MIRIVLRVQFHFFNIHVIFVENDHFEYVLEERKIINQNLISDCFFYPGNNTYHFTWKKFPQTDRLTNIRIHLYFHFNEVSVDIGWTSLILRVTLTIDMQVQVVRSSLRIYFNLSAEIMPTISHRGNFLRQTDRQTDEHTNTPLLLLLLLRWYWTGPLV